MQARFIPVLALFSLACSYNQRVEAPDATPAGSTPFVPPTPPTPDTTAPGNVSSVVIAASNNTLQLSWVNPADTDHKGTRIYWATSAANLNSAGTRTLLCENCLPGLLHTGITNGSTYHYLFMPYDYSGNAAAGVTSSATPVNNAFSCPDTSAVDCLQIASFNLEYFVSGFSGTNSPTLQQSKQTGAANIILNNSFDIVALQEVKDYSVFTSWVTNYLGAGWSYTVSSSGCDAKTAFLYKTALVSLVSVTELSASPFNTGDWDGCLRRPLAAVFKATATNRIFRLVNVHLKSGSDSTSCATRQPQAVNLNDYLNSTSTLPTILLGDMNDEVKSGVGICTSIDTLNSLETNGALSILTKSPTMEAGLFSNIPYSSTIDHLIVNSALSPWVVPARLTYTADVVAHGDLNISDHQPVFLWIKLK